MSKQKIWSQATLSLAMSLIAAACGAKSTNTSVESSDARAAQLRDSFQCPAVELGEKHNFDRSPTTLIYSFYSSGELQNRSLNIYGDGKVVARSELSSGEKAEASQSLNVDELDALLFDLVDKHCLLSITEDSVNAKIKTINAAYESAHPGKGSYAKAQKADCGKPQITITLDGKEYSSAFNVCNSFNTYLDSGSTVAEEKFVADAHDAAYSHSTAVLNAP